MVKMLKIHTLPTMMVCCTKLATIDCIYILYTRTASTAKVTGKRCMAKASTVKAVD